MHGQTSPTGRTHARRLSKTMTEAEQALWRRLRGRQLGVKFRRQHPFGRYVLDFVCLERMLVIEVDGSQHVDAAIQDAARTRDLERAGFRVLRFWNNEVLTEMEAALERIWRELEASSSRRGYAPSPSQPPLEGGKATSLRIRRR